MKRRLNYTNRRSLTLEHVKISLQDQKDLPPRFTAHIEVPKSWNISPSAQVYIEAYVASTAMRFSFGTVNNITHPANTTLRDIDSGNLLFRVKIVDESGDIGMLLASAEEVRPIEVEGGEAEGTRAFFPLAMMDLGQAIWKIEITKSDGPRLLLNNQIPGLKERLLSDPLLQGAILPFAMQVVLDKVLTAEEYGECEWLADWKTFVESISGNVFPPDDEEIEDDDASIIISNAVAAFIESKRFGDRAKISDTGDSSE